MGGILSVPRGQTEAAKALGLSNFQTMRKIVLPQALRVIIPSLTSQYVNIAKNSSLAIAIGYTDIYRIASTTINQTGRPVNVILIIMGSVSGYEFDHFRKYEFTQSPVPNS